MIASTAALGYLAARDLIVGPYPIGLWNIFALLSTILAAVGVWKRWPSAHMPASVACWHNTLWCFFWAERGSDALWVAVALSSAAGIALSFAKPAFPGLVSEEKQKAPVVPGLWAKENAESILIALTMALIIRCFCIEVFKIPSSSMEPTLLGGEPDHTVSGCDFEHYHERMRTGDRIMATKHYYAFSPVERFDVVVFKHPLNQSRTLIKRVVGLPDEELFIDHGNIFTRPRGGGGDFRLARKSLRTQQSIWIRDRSSGLDSAENFRKYWETDRGDDRRITLDRGTLVTRLNENADVRLSHVDKNAGETRVAFDLELSGTTGEFFVDVPNVFGRFKLRLTPDAANAIEWWWMGEKRQSLPLKTAQLVPKRRYRVEFMVYDGVALATLDGRVEAELTWCPGYEKDLATQSPGPLEFSAKGILFALSRLEIGRDIHYEAPSALERIGWPEDKLHALDGRDNAVPIPADSFMMMGDNVKSSHDARKWLKYRWVLNDGTEVVAETLEVHEGGSRAEEYRKTHELAVAPDWYIASDQIGYERAFNKSDVKDGPNPQPYWAVERKYIVGKALWCWFPPGRWFRLLR